MSCTNPQCFVTYPAGSGLKARHINGDSPWYGMPSGFMIPELKNGRVTYLPCGGCLSCRIERRQDLTMLQLAEASLHRFNWFLTLTYDDAKWPFVHSLRKQHLRRFFELLRHRLNRRGLDCRYFACGEYGDNFGRPHYHATLFGVPPDLLGIEDDKASFDARCREFGKGRLAYVSRSLKDSNGNNFWHSKLIDECWQLGNHMLYLASRETMQYVAGYVVKKLNGKEKRDQFDEIDMESPFCLQSRPSIGYPFWLKYHDRLSQPNGVDLVNDFISCGDRTWRIPRIMDKWRERNFPLVDHEEIKILRSRGCPTIPDFDDLRRKAEAVKYKSWQYSLTNQERNKLK